MPRCLVSNYTYSDEDPIQQRSKISIPVVLQKTTKVAVWWNYRKRTLLRVGKESLSLLDLKV